MCPTKIDLEAIYPRCCLLLGSARWHQIISGYDLDRQPGNFSAVIRAQEHQANFSDFLPELARLEWIVAQAKEKNISIPDNQEGLTINPTLLLHEFSWKHLAPDIGSSPAREPEPGNEQILIWKHPEDGAVKIKAASPDDLLILKMISENIDTEKVAQAGALPAFVIDAAVNRAIETGMIIAPASLIRRDFDIMEASPFQKKKFLVSPSFTLQWHITQLCDLHCRHCYDRSDRSSLTLKQALNIIDDFDAFCRERHVNGQISFTGGNPLLHPDFLSIYQAAADRRFTLFVLGNPTTREEIEALAAIKQPDYYQVSLEGLSAYNDFIRGNGHFERTIGFLAILRELGVYSMVMLTLTKGNINQVLPLAEMLRGKADVFYFNRLSQVGQGASLELPLRQDYISFLETYIAACENNPVLGLKDNLINIINHQKGWAPFGGCTGFGCGAAFNFIAVLADGEVHACRKFPSPLGNILDQRIAEIYDSEIAKRYRSGCAECRLCHLRPVCGGCLASAYSCGLDVFEKKDPFCFL